MPSTPSASPASPSSRKFAWLATAIVAGCVAWTIGWYLFAMKIETHLPATLAQIAGSNASAACGKAEVRGYPFRFGLFCDSMSYADTFQGVTASAGEFRSAAQFYRPAHVVAEIDGPLSIAAPGLDARIDWRVLQASVQAAPGGIDRGSLDAHNISFDIDGAGLARKLDFRADRINAHVRKNGPDCDIAVYADRLQNSLVEGLTAQSFTLEATLSGQAGLLDAPYPHPAGPVEILLHGLMIGLDDASSLDISGPVEIDALGRISGDLQVTVRNQQRVTELAAKLDPDLAVLLNRFAPLISALDTRPGDDSVTLPLTIRDNRVSLRMFPLGELPGF